MSFNIKLEIILSILKL